MRDTFAKEVLNLAKRDERIVLLSGDIGNRMFDEYKSLFPDRFYNCGVAEANMMGVAAGMGMSGLIPVLYTITPFITTRCLEQIRVDICYHEIPAIIVGTGAGLSYAQLGPTHHSCEDIALMRVLPEMSVVCPCDAVEVVLGLRAAVEYNKPVYLRLGKKKEPVFQSPDCEFTIGKSITIEEGDDVCFLSTGNIMPVVLGAREQLQQSGISARVESFHTVKPLDEACLDEVFNRFRLVITVEEHSKLGGLGGSVAEWSALHPGKARLLSLGTEDVFLHETGSQQYARKRFGLEPNTISEKVKQLFQELN